VPSALVYNGRASQVDTVIIDGQIVMRSKEITVVDEKAVLAQVRTVSDRLFERAERMKYSLEEVKW
jgi:5-methylthioadenosine/S-adenosylhomocysteine deaminase